MGPASMSDISAGSWRSDGEQHGTTHERSGVSTAGGIGIVKVLLRRAAVDESRIRGVERGGGNTQGAVFLSGPTAQRCRGRFWSRRTWALSISPGRRKVVATSLYLIPHFPFRARQTANGLGPSFRTASTGRASCLVATTLFIHCWRSPCGLLGTHSEPDHRA